MPITRKTVEEVERLDADGAALFCQVAVALYVVVCGKAICDRVTAWRTREHGQGSHLPTLA